MDIASTMLTYIRTQLQSGSGTVSLDTKLTEDGHLDSTAMLELILWVSDTFNISVQAEDFSPENFGTPRNIIDFVEQRATSGPTSGQVAATQPSR